MKGKQFSKVTQRSGQKPERFALIIGAMKAGTTSLFDILSQHPEICPSKEKEPDYFIKDSNDKSREKYLELWDWDNNYHSIALESSVAYTKVPDIMGVPERIYKGGLGRYRFIYMLRHPLDRIESQVRHGLFAGWGKSLDDGVSDDLINFSRYTMQIDKYLEYYSKDEIMIITLDEFRNEPQNVLTRICEFLEIDKSFNFQNVNEKRNSGDFFNSSPIISRFTHGKIGQFLLRKIIPHRIKVWLRKSVSNFTKGREECSPYGRWKLNHEERILILNRLAEDLVRLETEYGIDVRECWNIPPQILARAGETGKIS